MNDLDLVIVGGCGHVGLPLALSLAESGFRVGINDIDEIKVAQVKAGNVPFRETGAEELLAKLLPTGRLELSADPGALPRRRANFISGLESMPVTFSPSKPIGVSA